MMITYLFAGIVFSILAVVAYPLSGRGGESGSFLAQIVQLVLDIIPDNMLQAFAVDNDLQVITIAVFTVQVPFFLNKLAFLENFRAFFN